MREARRDRTALATATALALAMALLAPVARVLFPRLFVMGEDGSFVTAGLLALLVYASPVIVVAARRATPVAMAATGIVALAAARLAVQFLHPIPGWLAIGATVVALIGATGMLVGLAGRRTLRMLPVAVVAGLALDTAVRVPAASWEPVWRSGIGPASLAIGTVALAGVALTAALRDRTIDAGAGVSAGAVAAIGPFLMLQLVFVQNLGWVGSQASVSLPVAAVAILVADALALGAAALVAIGPRRPGVGVVLPIGVATVALTIVVSAVEGPWAIAVMLVLQVTAAVCLMVAASSEASVSRIALVLAATAASVGFLLLALLWQLHIDRPLPFPRAVVPAVAGLWLAGSAMTAVSRVRRDTRSREAVPALAAATGIVALCLVATAVVALSWPSPEIATHEGTDVRVVSFNVRGGVGPDAMLDVDAIARSIAASRPDVVVLQEVARGWPVFGAGDLLADLERRLGMSSAFEPAADGQFGNAILSRLPMRRVAGGALPPDPGEQRRSFLTMRVRTASGPLDVTATHLGSGAIDQIDALLAGIESGATAIVAGDMNMQPTDAASVARFEHAGLVDTAAATGDPCRTTSVEPTSSCDRPDWVWVTPDLDVARFAIGDASASDHLPIEVTLTLP